MEREEFKQKAKESIDDLFAEIEKLEAKMSKAKADAKVKYAGELETLRQKKAEMESLYDKLENTVGEKWEEIRTAFVESAPSFKAGFSRLGKIFKK
jgi:phage host-nuclease inhibitor protein Gam